jgi:hypothetical protein
MGKWGFDGHTQTAYANAIYMHMLKPDLIKKRAIGWLISSKQMTINYQPASLA